MANKPKKKIIVTNRANQKRVLFGNVVIIDKLELEVTPEIIKRLEVLKAKHKISYRYA